MAVKTRNQLNTDNAALFVNNTTGDITPAEEKVYNEDVNDSAALLIDDNHFTGINTHEKEVRWHKGAGLTAATALALGNTGNYHHVTGDTEIETLTTKQHGTRMLLYFVGNPNLKDSVNLLLGGVDIQTNAGSSAEFISEGSGVWRLINYKTGYQSSGLVPFKQAVTNAEILAESRVYIDDIPAPPTGYVWIIMDAALSFTPGTVAFDGGGRVRISFPASNSYQCYFAGAVFTTLDPIFITANPSIINDSTDGSNVIIDEQPAIYPEGMEDGDGDFIVYGSARLMKL